MGVLLVKAWWLARSVNSTVFLRDPIPKHVDRCKEPAQPLKDVQIGDECKGSAEIEEQIAKIAPSLPFRLRRSLGIRSPNPSTHQTNPHHPVHSLQCPPIVATEDASDTTPPSFHVLSPGVVSCLKMYLDIPNIFAHITMHRQQHVQSGVHLF